MLGQNESTPTGADKKDFNKHAAGHSSSGVWRNNPTGEKPSKASIEDQVKRNKRNLRDGKENFK